jgi:hypothetical protein
MYYTTLLKSQRNSLIDVMMTQILLGTSSRPQRRDREGVSMRYHAKERITGPNASAWLFEERETTLSATSMLLVQVMIAKAEDKKSIHTHYSEHTDQARHSGMELCGLGAGSVAESASRRESSGNRRD